jgi:hypothetical protein
MLFTDYIWGFYINATRQNPTFPITLHRGLQGTCGGVGPSAAAIVWSLDTVRVSGSELPRAGTGFDRSRVDEIET